MQLKIDSNLIEQNTALNIKIKYLATQRQFVVIQSRVLQCKFIIRQSKVLNLISTPPNHYGDILLLLNAKKNFRFLKFTLDGAFSNTLDEINLEDIKLVIRVVTNDNFRTQLTS